ncbi:hypothetical protein LCGC14_2260120 [marine sediment metagenome]|uniref:Uncharacterized protein n=1 Tax=marine sediment metagenome TaxID=412755 RepID=A0A0F9D081_9ZZZZ
MIDLKGKLTMSMDDKPVLIVLHDEKPVVVDFIEMMHLSHLMNVGDPKEVHILIEKV